MTEGLPSCINKKHCKNNSYSCITDSSICGDYNVSINKGSESIMIDYDPLHKNIHIWCADESGGYIIVTLLVKDGIWTVRQ